MAPGSEPASSNRILVLSMVSAGLITIGVGVFLGATVEPVLYAIALLALVDFAIAWAYSSGRAGPTARRRSEAEASGDLAAEVEADPLYNPYARED